jgi:protein-disulfide reductase (glutathione)
MVSSRRLRTPAKLAKFALVARAALVFGAAALGLGLLACVEPPQREGAEQAAAQPKRTATIPADGWNDRIAWRGLDEGLREAKQAKMPVMLVVHTSWCSNCQNLKATFNRDRELERLSERFVMVHVDQDHNPEALRYGPDGQYIPRVMFLDSNGKLDARLQNPNQPRFRYFYTPHEDLVATMRQALDRHGN